MVTDFFGWIGAFLMVVFSFTLIPLVGIWGLLFLTVQAFNARLFNLVILNILSILGLFINYFGA
jgi:hypothetical protein